MFVEGGGLKKTGLPIILCQTNMQSHWRLLQPFSHNENGRFCQTNQSLFPINDQKSFSQVERCFSKNRYDHIEAKRLRVRPHTLLTDKMKPGASAEFGLFTGFSPLTFTGSQQTHIYCGWTCDYVVSLRIVPLHSVSLSSLIASFAHTFAPPRSHSLLVFSVNSII